MKGASRRAHVAVLASLLAATASAQVGGVHLHRLDAELRLRAEARDETTADVFRRIHERETSLREDLLLDLSGDIYHSKLAEFDIRAEVGLEQQAITGGSRSSQSVNGTNFGFDARMRLLKDWRYTGTLYGQRFESRTRQTFFETTETVVMEAGADIDAKEWVLPSRLHYHHRTTDTRGGFDNDETRDNLKLEGSSFDESANYQYSLEYNKVDLESFGISYDDYSALFSTTHRFGGENADLLSNSLLYRKQSGSISSEALTNRNDLSVHLTEDLVSASSLGYDENSFGAGRTKSRSLTASTGLNHRLYDSLSTGLGVGASASTFRSGRIDRLGPFANVGYRKRMFFGALRANYTGRAYEQREKNGLEPTAVVDEAHLFRVGTPILLDATGIDVTSMVVTDATGATLYTTPRDYIVSAFRGRVRLDIPVSSRIVDGQRILVDYLFAPLPDRRFRSVEQAATLGLDFGQLVRLELGWSDIDQDIVSGIDDDRLEDSTTKRANLTMEHDRHQIGVSYEDRDSRFTPYTRLGATALTGAPLWRNAEWQVTGSTYRTRFKDDGEIERSLNVGSSLSTIFGGGIRGDLRGEYRWIDLRTDRGSGWFVKADLDYRFRASEIALRLEYSTENFDVASDRRTLYAMLSFKRRF